MATLRGARGDFVEAALGLDRSETEQIIMETAQLLIDLMDVLEQGPGEVSIVAAHKVLVERWQEEKRRG